MTKFVLVNLDFHQVVVGTTSLDFLFVNLSDVLFKFIHALILQFTFKLRNITSF